MDTAAPPPPSEPCLAAAPALATCEAVRAAVGEELYARALAALPADAREEIVALTPVGWVRIRSMRVLFDAVAAHSGRDADLLTDEAVRAATARTFRTIWRVLLQVVSDDAILKRAPAIYSRSRNVGAVTVRDVTRGTATLAVHGWPGITERDLRSVAVATRSILEVAGRRDVHCTWSLASDGGTIALRWKG